MDLGVVGQEEAPTCDRFLHTNGPCSYLRSMTDLCVMMGARLPLPPEALHDYLTTAAERAGIAVIEHIGISLNNQCAQ